MPEGDVALEASDFQLVFELNPHPMWIFDLETLRLLDVNRAAVSHYGYSRAEFLGLTIRDLRPADDIPRLNDHLPTTRDITNPRTTLWRHKKKDGSLIDVEISSFKICFAGRPAKLVMVSDLTERHQVAESIRALLGRILTGLRAVSEATSLDAAREFACALEKDADAELDAAIRTITHGPSLRWPLNDFDGKSPLSEREREVLLRVARGHTNREVAEELGLSIKSVEAYRARCMGKLGLRTRVELVRYCLDCGYLRPGR
jgi:PAS domain S-box-containing protein